MGQSLSGAVPGQRAPYTQQWNLAIGRQFKGDAMLEIGYAGSKGTFLPFNGMGGFAYNQIPDGSYNSSGIALTGPSAGQPLVDPMTHSPAVGQALRPYPYYGGLNDTLAYHASISYNSLQLKGEKRFGSGGTLMGNFVWAKQIGNTDTSTFFFETATQAGGFANSASIQDYNNLKAERSILSYEVPYRAVISYILNLPFGKGQKFGRDATGALNAIISGWGVNGITTLQHGFPVGVNVGHGGNYPLANNFGAGSLRPNFTAGCSKGSTYSGNDRINGWFKTSCFSSPGAYAYGNEPRVDTGISADGIKNFDFSMLKNTKVTEGTSLQFRAEFFNIFNRKQFGPPDGSLNDPTFGQVLSTDANQPRLIQLSLRVNF